MMAPRRVVWLPLLLIFFQGCAVLFGSVAPREEKSKRYVHLDLEKEKPDSWKRLNDPLASDVAYQRKGGAAIISINSSCGRTRDTRAPASPEANLSQLRSRRDRLYRGMLNPTLDRERMIRIGGLPALETTRVGRFTIGVEPELGPIVVQSVVVQNVECTYELLCVAPPIEADHALSEFSRFKKGFRW